MCCTATLHYFIALLVQHTNQAILERFMLTSEQAPTEVVIPDLSEDERSALYYAAGYVPFAHRKRFKEIRFVCAVDHLYSSYNIIVLYNFRPDLISILLRFDAWDECGDADTLHDYMRHAEKIDRGGLCKINSKCFNFFEDLELITRKHITAILNNQAITKKEIVQSITKDEDMLFSWVLLVTTGDASEDDLTNELLIYVVELWLTIRGNSCAGDWMEYYKQSKQELVQRKKSLRKTLKRGKSVEE